jgi:hypothetical protein
MSRRAAKKAACAVAARLIDSYMGVGQPGGDCEEHAKGWIPADEDVLIAAFEELQDELIRRSGDVAYDKTLEA